MRLWRHKNKTWYVLYGPRLGRRISTKTPHKREAEQFLARFIATEGLPVGRLVTVGEILNGYMADKEKTVRAPNSLKFAVKGLQPLADLFPSHLTPPVIRKWASERGVANGTILREVGVLRAALGWAAEHKWLAVQPTISNPVRTPKSRRRWITKDEAKKLLAACKESHVKLFIMLGLMTVARTGAILEARWGQVDWERRTIDYGDGHGNKQRALVPLNGEMFSLLEGASRIACSEFIVEFRGEQVSSIKTGFAATCGRAEITGVTPHILRHSGATWMAIDGVPLSEIARMLGDSEAMVEKTYIKFTPEYLKGAADALQLDS